ncbi:MAG: squalene synthase HpnC [Thiogranum sp.]|nr:squalene synthase HpnC [Thiogranum sp.]
MQPDAGTDIGQAYAWCRNIVRSHYENFPVASLLLPRRLRDPIAAIYAFARTADDITDEGDASAQQRLQRLAEMEAALMAAADGAPPPSLLYVALADSIARHRLPPVLLRQLLSAFRQDIEKKRYGNFGELMDYCKRSANPVGRLLLHLLRRSGEREAGLSDAVCSALQLTNFLQDIAQDYRENGRIYIPQDEMQRFGVSEQDIADQRNSPRLAQLMQFQVQRATRLLRAGSPLGREIGGRFGLELRAVVLGAARVLEKLHSQQDAFARPRLGRLERTRILLGALASPFNRAQWLVSRSRQLR